MRIGFYAGSFDPFTNGHLHVIEQASKIFDKLIVGVGTNQDKGRRYDREQMKDVMNQVLNNRGLTNVEVYLFDGLCVDAANQYGANVLVRGIRNGMDYDYEENLALVNNEISGLDTVYFRAGKYGCISSSMVMDLLKNNRDISNYVPNEVQEFLKR